MSSLASWLNNKSKEEHLLFIKRLSANDTGATGSNQSGIYINPEIMERVVPSICHRQSPNPSKKLFARISSHAINEREILATYYNSKFFGGSVNEYRFTRWGGRYSPLMDHDNTGSLVIFSFPFEDQNISPFVDVWVCNGPDQDEEVQAIIGEIIPGKYAFGLSKHLIGGFVQNQTHFNQYDIPRHWHQTFPSGHDIIKFSSELQGYKYSLDPDERLMQRRRAEFDVFLFVEALHTKHLIRDGFDSVDSFIKIANSISNRRKSRAGRSLEIHLERIFSEEGLIRFDMQANTEGNKKPDFIFPSQMDYHNPYFPSHNLRMLAVKTTCKDRWRQALSEADRVANKHLFTLQEGVSLNQFNEMRDAGVQLVVPRELHKKYPKEIRHEIMYLSEFINEMKLLNY